MPTPIPPLSQALRLLKMELAQARDARAAATVNSPPVGSADASRQASHVAGTTALRGLPSRLRALAAQKGGQLAPAKALRLFVEAVLLDELGAELQLDPAFNDLVERTCAAIEQDAGSASLLSEAVMALDGLAQ